MSPRLFLPDPPHVRTKIALLCVPLAAMVGCYLWERFKRRPGALLAVLFLAVVSLSLESVHLTFVDQGHYFPPQQFADNTAWQEWMHGVILRRDPGGIPHTYRFLPDQVVGIIEHAKVGFAFSRMVYRETFEFLLVYAIFAFCRLFGHGPTGRPLTPEPASVHVAPFLAVLGYALIYPSSIRCYGGQIIDPMSHLSFVLSFILIYLRRPVAFFLVVAIGSAAKESVVAMCGLYFLWHLFRSRSFIPGILVTAGGVGVVVGIRWWINGGTFAYDKVSGVPPDWFKVNLSNPDWPRQVLFSMGVLVPFVVLGWRAAHPFLKALVLYVTPVLLLSNLLFSWMHETRNLVPASIVMSVILAQWIMSRAASVLAPPQSHPSPSAPSATSLTPATEPVPHAER